MENYIVRIYRRDGADPNKVVGVCESVEQETQDTFHTLGRLMSLISPTIEVRDESGEGEIPDTPSEKISVAD